MSERHNRGQPAATWQREADAGMFAQGNNRREICGYIAGRQDLIAAKQGIVAATTAEKSAATLQKPLSMAPPSNIR